MARVRSGDGAADSGARDVNGVSHGHYWIEGSTSQGHPFVADITADQFGWSPIVVLPLEVSGERYRPGSDAVCELAAKYEIKQMQTTSVITPHAPS